MRLRSRSLHSNPLRVGRYVIRFHVEVRFYMPVKTGPRAQPASCANNINMVFITVKHNFVLY
jgi:hypothetical protein